MSMIRRLAISEIFVFSPARFLDDRGHFTETFNKSALEPFTGPLTWVQDNQSFTAASGTIRGLHFQLAPHAQDKLVRCIRGKILDVAVDLRRGSPTFGQHVKAELDAEGGQQIFVPKGFAHAFLTLEPGCEVAYKVSSYYTPEAERGLAWNDPDLAIDWGLAGATPILSVKDAHAPSFAGSEFHFEYSS